MSEHDPLARYRRPGAPRPAPAAPPRPASGGRTEYVAFAAKDKVMDIQIIPRRGLSGQTPYYSYLVNITFDIDPDDDDNFIALLLTVSGMLILFEGRHLKPIYDALRLGNCDMIAEYDPARHLPLAEDYTGPVVTLIEVEIVRPGVRVREDEKEDA
jgi:hypothetical protein